jgi:glyoxylase-like metal-dependent hydrolase (beta-lactamase superfamily II)
MPTEVAPGITRLGNEIVNFYLVEDGGGTTLVDAGLPAFRGQLDSVLAGRRVDAVILTHGHIDHVGVAEGLRRDGTRVWIHSADAAMARDGVEQKTEGNLASYLRHRATWKLLGMALRSGGVRRPKIAEVNEFGDGEVLDVPGRPSVVHTPGHSNGHVVFTFGDRGVLMAGDALCTWNPLTGRPGPQLMPRAFATSLSEAEASLSRLEGLEAGVVLPGARRSVDRRGLDAGCADSRGGAELTLARANVNCGWVGGWAAGRGARAPTRQNAAADLASLHARSWSAHRNGSGAREPRDPRAPEPEPGADRGRAHGLIAVAAAHQHGGRAA